MSEPVWTRALAPADLGRRPEIVTLRPTRQQLPDLATLFTFMRDAELRFRSLRMRIEERTWVAAGERLATIDVAIRHPGHARVVTTRDALGGAPQYDSWLSDGEHVWTYSGASKVATARPNRRAPAGLDAHDLPGQSQVYATLTQLPPDSLPDVFIHPAGFCQNVLGTGSVWISRTALVGDREGIVVECAHPRSVLVVADRPDHHLQMVADTDTGIVLQLTETIGGQRTRIAEVADLRLDPPLPDSVFALNAPPGSRHIY